MCLTVKFIEVKLFVVFKVWTKEVVSNASVGLDNESIMFKIDW